MNSASRASGPTHVTVQGSLGGLGKEADSPPGPGLGSQTLWRGGPQSLKCQQDSRGLAPATGHAWRVELPAWLLRIQGHTVLDVGLRPMLDGGPHNQSDTM